MRDHAFATVMGFAIAALFSTPLLAAHDPFGIWIKEDGTAKMEIKKCGRNQLCSSIVWLKDPNDSRGRPLRDARNENPSLRNREIMGLQIFRGLTPVGRASWSGQIYNPEDGNTYKATLTLVSSRQIVLKGCKAFGLLCGQKVWTRSKLDSTPPQVEAAAEPEEPKVQTASAAPEPPAVPSAAPAPQRKPGSTAETASSEPGPPPATKRAPTPAPEAMAQLDPAAQDEPGPVSPQHNVRQANAAPQSDASEGLPRVQSVVQRTALQPEVPHLSQDAPAGYGVIMTTVIPPPAPPFTSEKPSTMFAMAPRAGRPVAAPAPAPESPPAPAVESVEEAALEPEQAQAAQSVPLPDQKPKVIPRPRPQTAAQKRKQRRPLLPWLR